VGLFSCLGMGRRTLLTMFTLGPSGGGGARRLDGMLAGRDTLIADCFVD
jgi:hypothetical protein